MPEINASHVKLNDTVSKDSLADINASPRGLGDCSLHDLLNLKNKSRQKVYVASVDQGIDFVIDISNDINSANIVATKSKQKKKKDQKEHKKEEPSMITRSSTKRK